MDFQLSCTSQFSWIWVIETLACSNQVDVSLLLDLAEKTQEISDDLGRNARELVSLRILEIAFVKGCSVTPISTTSSPKIEFNPSERCEDVLKQILMETSALNLKTAGSDMLKWNLEPFIVQKRASLTKYALRQLKDAILTGSHPLDVSVKEKSELSVRDRPGPEISRDGGNHFITPTIGRSNKSVQYGAAHGPSSSSDLNNDIGFAHRNLPLDNLLPAKRDRSYSSQNDGRKFCDDDTMREDGCETLLKVSKNLEITNEDMDKFEQNIQKNPPNVGEAEKYMEGVLVFKTTHENTKTVEQSAPINASNTGECEEDLTIFSDSGYDEERTDNVMQKHTFLSSQFAFSLDSLATTDWGEQNLCVKCGRDGKLLVCKANACPLVVHEGCLGSAASFDTMGKFECPSCAYSQAIKQYEETKKKTLSARKDLSTFYGFGTRRQSNKQPLVSNEMELCEHTGKTSEVVRGDPMNGSENNQNKRKLEEMIGPSALSCGNNLPVQGKPVESTIGALLTYDKINQDEKRKGKVCQSLVDEGHHQMTALVVYKCLGENSFRQVSERGTRETESTGAEEMSDEENESSDASKYIIKYRNVESSYPSVDLLRRMRVPWKSAEEETLKEGVRIHLTPHDRNIPWRKILEYGAGIFHKDRTAMDLKNKWRNISKAYPNS